MTWPKYVLLGLYAASALANIAMVGKERKPITPSGAIASVLVAGGMATLVIIA